MSWRTVVVKNRCKLSYKNDYLLVQGDDGDKTLHISEIGTLIIENTAVSLTAYLLAELAKFKVKVVLCDQKRNPYGEIIPYYGSHNASKQMRLQSKWSQEQKDALWQRIVQQKIIKQAQVLHAEVGENASTPTLMSYAEKVTPGDKTNREAHAAKLYFKALFGEKFSRDSSSPINASLNYGYAILLSTFNREISAVGYATTMGVNHCNEYNPFNLTCDLMESFRPLIDREVYRLRSFAFDDFIKERLVEVLNQRVRINDSEQYVSNAISMYTKAFFRSITDENASSLYDYELL